MLNKKLERVFFSDSGSVAIEIAMKMSIQYWLNKGFKNKKTKDIIKPYYTTKEKGTGLGLSIVDKIINDHNGSIKFLNTNNGAKVQIIIPK